MSRCLLPACSASPFAVLGAARIGYVECPFNGLYTHAHAHRTQRERIVSFNKPFRACTRVPRRLIAMNCCRMIFILFRFQFAPPLFPFARRRHVIIPLRVLQGNYGTLLQLTSWPADQGCPVEQLTRSLRSLDAHKIERSSSWDWEETKGAGLIEMCVFCNLKYSIFWRTSEIYFFVSKKRML